MERMYHHENKKGFLINKNSRNLKSNLQNYNLIREESLVSHHFHKSIEDF